MIPYIFTAPLGLFLGTLYPAYASYKAVRTKNVGEYVKWMMYWIVFAAFSAIETFTDIFVAFWFPFYYEVKILLLIWLISPVSRGSLGSSIIYRKFVHPNLMKKEDEIDRWMQRLRMQGYDSFTYYGTRAFTYISNFVMQTAIRAPTYVAQVMAEDEGTRRTANALELQQNSNQDQVDAPMGGHTIQHQDLISVGGAGNENNDAPVVPESATIEEVMEVEVDEPESAPGASGLQLKKGRKTKEKKTAKESKKPGKTAAAANASTYKFDFSSDSDDDAVTEYANSAADPDFKEPTTNKRGRPKGVANKGTRASKRRNPSNT